MSGFLKRDILEASPLEPPPGLCPGPTGGLAMSLRSQLYFGSPGHYQVACNAPGVRGSHKHSKNNGPETICWQGLVVPQANVSECYG